MIDGGYLLTNTRVVHGTDTVRVVFPDGSEFLDVPLKRSNDLIDLAVLGLINTDIPALRLTGREDLGIGSELLLVGYPAEPSYFLNRPLLAESYPGPGERDAIGMTYFQTDAPLAGGQSGGALISEPGEVIGISGFRFSDAGFGLVASAGNLAPLAEALILGKDASVLSSRPYVKNNGAREHQLALKSIWDTRSFLIDAPVGSTVNLQIEGLADGFIWVLDPIGITTAFEDSSTTLLESVSVKIDFPGRYRVAVGLSLGSEGDFTVSGDADLIAENDPDDGSAIAVGDVVAGNIDFIGDFDYFRLELEEGKTVEIRVESLNIDAYLSFDFPGARPEQILEDDDSGGGLFGTDSTMYYRPIRSGVHYVADDDAVLANSGGYLISVTEAPADAAAAEIPASYKTVESPFGLMTVLSTRTQDIQYTSPPIGSWMTTLKILHSTTEMLLVIQ